MSLRGVMRKPSEWSLTDKDLAELRAWAEGREDRSVRLRIVQDAAAGLSVSQSARAIGISRPTVTAWRQRYAAHGLAGLEHRPRSGRPARIDEADVIAATLAGPPPPQRTWSARALADHLGLSHTALGRVWQRWQIRPGSSDTTVVLPVGPALTCHRPELLAVGARPDGRAFVVLAEAVPSGQPRMGAATAEERQMRYAALTAVMRQALPDGTEEDRRTTAEGSDFAQPAGSSGSVRALPVVPALAVSPLIAGRWAGRRIHVITWGDTRGPANLPANATHHAAPASMGWAATVCLMAQLELQHQPQRARVALDLLADTARSLAKAPPGTPFWWLREGQGEGVPRRRTVHRAFDQLALGSFNEKLVIESVRVAGSLSRVEIAERTGLTPQAVSRITRNLLTTGFLVEDERRWTGKGKPRVPLKLRPDAAFAIGIHVDPEQITHVLVDLCGNVRDRRCLPVTPDSDPRSCLEWMAETTRQSVDAAGPLGTKLLGVGVAAPGPLDVHEGVLLNPPLWSKWGEFPLRAELHRMLELPTILEKDATAATIGEQWLGAGESSTDFVYLYLGAGAGSGAFLNGDVYRGASGNAGEFGELTAYALQRLTPEGGPEMVPECAPMSAVVARAVEAGLSSPDGEITYEAVCAAAADGDERAVRAIRDVAVIVARGAVAMTDLYDIDLMIVGGPAVPPEVAELYLSEISTAVNRFPMARRVRTVRVTYSTLSASAAAVGAAAGVFHMAFAPRLRTHSGTAS
ncbi:ROK family protein [Streptomyces spinosisporus]|uniref:ROK family protein n=1 Tax=Streptomyces spinosisporus TaxID=2927582 RepID=A0ABS9XA08_9ACTN|nr:ROK family protein [Streptomyces spinosisporus]MCI3238929.1 ROK family protein [Streptomyces spinosisporus]